MPTHALLTAAAHRDLRIDTGRGAALGDAVMAAITVPSEFREIQGDYPILFRRDAEGDGFTALALLGFETGENLFLDGTRWTSRYVPLSIAIQPFLIGRAAPDSELKQVHIDLDHPRAHAAEGTRVFDDGGRPTPYLEEVAERLGTLDAGMAASRALVDALRDHDLLEPLTLEVTGGDGSVNRLVGFHVIDEARLQALDAAALGYLQAQDFLMPIFMAVASLGRLRTLIALREERRGRG